MQKRRNCLEKSFEYGFCNSLDHAVFVTLIGGNDRKTLYADMPVEWAVSYDPRTDASDLVPESDNKALPFFSDGADTPYTFYTF